MFSHSTRDPQELPSECEQSEIGGTLTAPCRNTKGGALWLVGLRSHESRWHRPGDRHWEAQDGRTASLWLAGLPALVLSVGSGQVEAVGRAGRSQRQRQCPGAAVEGTGSPRTVCFNHCYLESCLQKVYLTLGTQNTPGAVHLLSGARGAGPELLEGMGPVAGLSSVEGQQAADRAHSARHRTGPRSLCHLPWWGKSQRE